MNAKLTTPAATALPIADALWDVLVTLNAAGDDTHLPYETTGSPYALTSAALVATLTTAYGSDLAVRIRDAAGDAYQRPSTIVENVLREARTEAEDAHAAAVADYANADTAADSAAAWDRIGLYAAWIDRFDTIARTDTIAAERAAELV